MRLFLLAVLASWLGMGNAHAAEPELATFAGGCFWCMDAEFAQLPGVVAVRSGFTGGTVANPTYEQVSAGDTGHVEAIEIAYDPAKLSYTQLLTIFWENVDPLDPDGQFCDKGTQYRAGIFTHDAEQARLAEASLMKIKQRLGAQVAAFVKPAGPFYAAEAYHQDYYRKNRLHYRMYRMGCGRDERLNALKAMPTRP